MKETKLRNLRDNITTFVLVSVFAIILVAAFFKHFVEDTDTTIYAVACLGFWGGITFCLYGMLIFLTPFCWPGPEDYRHEEEEEP